MAEFSGGAKQAGLQHHHPEAGIKTPAARASGDEVCAPNSLDAEPRLMRAGTPLEIRVLGPLEVTVAGRALALGGKRQRAVLAVLVVHLGQALSLDRLADEVWGGEPPEAVATTVRAYVCRLRRALASAAGPDSHQVLQTVGSGYVLRVPPEHVDSYLFERRIGEARSRLDEGQAELAAVTLANALRLWRGRAFGDFASEPFARAEAVRLEELRLTALELEMEANLALGRHAEIVGRLKALVAAHPLHESFSAQLMVALYRCGRQADALRVYQSLRQTLIDELGIQPSPYLRFLEQAILLQEAWVAEPAPVLRRRGAA